MERKKQQLQRHLQATLAVMKVILPFRGTLCPGVSGNPRGPTVPGFLSPVLCRTDGAQGHTLQRRSKMPSLGDTRVPLPLSGALCYRSLNGGLWCAQEVKWLLIHSCL